MNRAGLAALIYLTVCACGPQSAGDKPVDPEADNAPITALAPGIYAIGDGTEFYVRTRLNADGTYTDLGDAMEPIGGGTWRNDSSYVTCFDPEDDRKVREERCWAYDEARPDGSFMTRRVGGMEHYLVTPIGEDGEPL
ncbi:MAG: hypothetical protein WBA51_02700 [Erythrobacter sp.]